MNCADTLGHAFLIWEQQFSKFVTFFATAMSRRRSSGTPIGCKTGSFQQSA
jgi:hypothetical protein